MIVVCKNYANDYEHDNDEAVDDEYHYENNVDNDFDELDMMTMIMHVEHDDEIIRMMTTTMAMMTETLTI
jgi:hypothetical protein